MQHFSLLWRYSQLLLSLLLFNESVLLIWLTIFVRDRLILFFGIFYCLVSWRLSLIRLLLLNLGHFVWWRWFDKLTFIFRPRNGTCFLEHGRTSLVYKSSSCELAPARDFFLESFDGLKCWFTLAVNAQDLPDFIVVEDVGHRLSFKLAKLHN